MSRRKFTDHPAIVFYSLIGRKYVITCTYNIDLQKPTFASNDVCTMGPDPLAEMTPPDAFYKNTLGTLKFLEGKLPPGSHVVLIGLIDGGMIYETMAHRLHPIGQLGSVGL